MCPVFKACEIASDFIPALIQLKIHMDDLPYNINKFDIAPFLLELMILLYFPNKTETQNILCLNVFYWSPYHTSLERMLVNLIFLISWDDEVLKWQHFSSVLGSYEITFKYNW